ncbi:MAG: hypothetical protein V3V10_04305 [Planctomycetota bacterium]
MAASVATAMLDSQWATLVADVILVADVMMDVATAAESCSTVEFVLVFVEWFLAFAACSLDADAKLLLLADAKLLLLLVVATK